MDRSRIWFDEEWGVIIYPWRGFWRAFSGGITWAFCSLSPPSPEESAQVSSSSIKMIRRVKYDKSLLWISSVFTPGGTRSTRHRKREAPSWGLGCHWITRAGLSDRTFLWIFYFFIFYWRRCLRFIRSCFVWKLWIMIGFSLGSLEFKILRRVMIRLMVVYF